MRLRWPKLARDTILAVVGAAILFHETVVFHGERPTLLLVAAALLGLPVFLRTDERLSPPDPPDRSAVGLEIMKQAVREERERLNREQEEPSK